jgi:hypothetical protein
VYFEGLRAESLTHASQVVSYLIKEDTKEVEKNRRNGRSCDLVPFVFDEIRPTMAPQFGTRDQKL